MKRTAGILVTAALAVGLPALAADQSQQQRQQGAQQTQQQSSQQSAAGGQAGAQAQQSKTITGKITSLSTVEAQGQQEKHLLARVETEDGKQMLVDLGSEKKVKESGKSEQIKKGQQIQVSGTMGKINGKDALMAKNVNEPGGQMIVVVTELIPMQLVSVPQMISGKIQSIDKGSGENQNMTAELETSDGKTVTLDLGSGKEVQRDLKLQQGEWITSRGIMAQVEGKPTFIVTDLADIARIPAQDQRAAPAGGAMGGQPQQQQEQQQQPANEQ